jgi:hypothetical protein
LLQRYTETHQDAPPTASLDTLKRWSTNFGWSERAEIYDANLERQKNELTQQRRREAMETGLALDHERVLELKRLADFLITQAYEKGETGIYHNVWLPDVRLSKDERVDIERFNSAIIEQIRGTLDDLAKETGGRKQAVQHSGSILTGLIILPAKEE